MKQRSVMIGVVLGIMILAGGLAACSSQSDSDTPGFIHIEEGAAETEVAQTAAALRNPTATPGPTPTPTLTATPYVRPTDDPAVDGDTVITRVGNDEITLAEYRRRVRFDRYRLLFPIVKLAEKYGTEELLDLTRQENWYLTSLFTTLADSYSLGVQSHRIMVIESIAFQEARRRGLEVDPYRFDAKLGEWLGVQVGEGGKLPPEFDTRYEEFIAGIETYADMTEEEFRRIVRAQTLYDQLEFLIGQEADINTSSEATVGVKVQDIMVQNQAEAELIAMRLQDNEPLRDIAQSLGYQPATEDTDRTLRRGDEALPDYVLEAVFQAQPGDVIGPVRIPEGWYVAKVGTEVVDMLSPQDVEALRHEYFLDWVEAQMDDPDLVVDYDNWLSHTPQEPLPHDVSPLLRDENVTLPETTPDPFESGLLPEGLDFGPESDAGVIVGGE